MAKQIPSIHEAQELLRAAVEENKRQLTDALQSIRRQLEELVSVIGIDGLPREVHQEINALAQLRGRRQGEEVTSLYVRNSEKMEFIREQLKTHGGEMPKADLMDAARRHWTGRNISQQFLDRAICEEFRVRKEDNGTVTVELGGKS